MTTVLNEFVENTKILPTPVNENFSGLQQDIADVNTTLSGNITTLSTTVTSLSNTVTSQGSTITTQGTAISELQSTISGLGSTYADVSLSNINDTAKGVCRGLFWFNNNYMVGSGWTNNDAPGWVIFEGYSGEGVHCWGNVNGITVWRNDQSGGGGRAGAMGSTGICWIAKGGYVHFANASCRFIRCADY